MKRLNLLLGAALIAAGMTSCKTDTEQMAEQNIDRYESYVDSISRLDATERTSNWEAIDAEYNARLAEAEAALADAKDSQNAETRINDSKTEYENVKTETQNTVKETQGNALIVSYFGPNNMVGSDLNFDWVNKDNILSVYQNFVDTFEKNKDTYSREDFDQIKVWYEALDARKNTVEKEGLSSEDNNAIAKLKLEFAPKFKWERMTAKGEENKEAKEEAAE
ncbi:hypothetical protein FUA48_18085 [Flavobacterium alkalisoli]|uniref:Lipoprotein n=1 Tax=Flavobacterium alkalisoli TaxID=2602769 RepID=A0A5B9FZW8_9FLAO|nr:hypothetical protein [Flavobacterium alkalisoli]QEE51408.1 hypothetical protein FUA48_18085 [Flavobacterium alkalisoli]